MLLIVYNYYNFSVVFINETKLFGVVLNKVWSNIKSSLARVLLTQVNFSQRYCVSAYIHVYCMHVQMF